MKELTRRNFKREIKKIIGLETTKIFETSYTDDHLLDLMTAGQEANKDIFMNMLDYVGSRYIFKQVAENKIEVDLANSDYTIIF